MAIRSALGRALERSRANKRHRRGQQHANQHCDHEAECHWIPKQVSLPPRRIYFFRVSRCNCIQKAKMRRINLRSGVCVVFKKTMSTGGSFWYRPKYILLNASAAVVRCVSAIQAYDGQHEGTLAFAEGAARQVAGGLVGF